MSLFADGLPKEQIFDRQGGNRPQVREQLEQFAKSMRLGRVLFVDVSVEENLRLILKISDAGEVVAFARGVSTRSKEDETFQTNVFVRVDLQLLTSLKERAHRCDI